MVATLDRETVVTSASRTAGGVPARWVSTVETDGIPGAIHARLVAPRGGAHPSRGSAYPSTGADTLAGETGEFGDFFGGAVPEGTALLATAEEPLPVLFERALMLRVLRIVRSAVLSGTAFPPMLSVSVPRLASDRSTAAGQPPNAAVRAVEDLRQWLGITIDEVAQLAGVSRSAVLYWKRENAQPRPTPARNLFRLHALVRALRDAVAPASPMDVLSRVPEGAEASPFDLLMAGRYDDAERLLRPVLFPRDRQPVQPERYVRWPELQPPDLGAAGPLELRSPVKRARRVSLPK